MTAIAGKMLTVGKNAHGRRLKCYRLLAKMPMEVGKITSSSCKNARHSWQNTSNSLQEYQ
jgi:hypothetical protein